MQNEMVMGREGKDRSSGFPARRLRVERQHRRLIAADKQERGQIAAQRFQPRHVERSGDDTLARHRQRHHDQVGLAGVLEQILAQVQVAVRLVLYREQFRLRDGRSSRCEREEEERVNECQKEELRLKRQQTEIFRVGEANNSQQLSPGQSGPYRTVTSSHLAKLG